MKKANLKSIIISEKVEYGLGEHSNILGTCYLIDVTFEEFTENSKIFLDDDVVGTHDANVELCCYRIFDKLPIEIQEKLKANGDCYIPQEIEKGLIIATYEYNNLEDFQKAGWFEKLNDDVIKTVNYAEKYGQE
jgi:hypothetical protein